MANKLELFGLLIAFNLISTIIITTSIFIFVAGHDFLFIGVLNVTTDMESQGLVASEFVTESEDTINGSTAFLGIMDYLWVLSFIMLVIEMFFVSYFSPREGYFWIFTFVTYGIMFLLFISSLYDQVSDFMFDLMINGLLQGINVDLPFFTFYLDHFGLINMIIIFFCIILNFVDLDFSKFNARKVKEKIFNEEI